MPYVRCFCKTHNCNGVLTSVSTARTHERADLRQTTLSSQAQFKRVGRRILQPAQQVAGPVPRQYAVPLHEPPEPLSSQINFTDPIYDDLLILDHGNLMTEDLKMTTHDTMSPNLGPNFRTPEALLLAVQHFEAYNRAAAAGAHPLTSFVAHNLPPDPERRYFQRQLERAIDKVQEEQSCRQDDEVDADADFDMDFDIPDDEEDGGGPVLFQTDPDEDNPDPFAPDKDFPSPDHTDLSTLPPHLLSIYSLVSWLHLQFHLPKVACNALLAIFSCILLAIMPSIDAPFITLQSSNRVLGVDIPIYTTPCLSLVPRCISTRQLESGQLHGFVDTGSCSSRAD